MPTVEKTLGILGLFTPDMPVRTSDEIIAYLDCPASTGYRHIKTLQSTGFLGRVGSGSYMLGPRVLELDRTVRMSDPVYIAGGAALRQLRKATGHSVVLSILYSESVVCVRRDMAPDGPVGLFLRGERRPLVAGASAKAILAFLPLHQLRRIYANHAQAVAQAGLGEVWDAFRKALRIIRKNGFVMTAGEVHPNVAGVAAPVFNKDQEVLGSLMLAVNCQDGDTRGLAAHAPLVIAAAGAVSQQIAIQGGAALPARSVG